MQTITLILAVFALAAAAFALALILKEQLWRQELVDSIDDNFASFAAKGKKQREALLQYVDRTSAEAAARVSASVQEQLRGTNSDIERIQKAVRTVNTKAVAALKTSREHSERIEKLEQGVIPDYNEALKAVNAVNDMNSGITNILGFDPLEALKKGRQEGE